MGGRHRGRSVPAVALLGEGSSHLKSPWLPCGPLGRREHPEPASGPGRPLLHCAICGQNRSGFVWTFFCFRIPSTICFGQGASRGFKSTKKKSKRL